jgi:hypothetical protein
MKVTTINFFERYTLYLFSFLAASLLVYIVASQFHTHQNYDEFIAGALAWGATTKLQDMLSPFVFTAGFLAIILPGEKRLIRLKKENPALTQKISRYSFYLSIPLILIILIKILSFTNGFLLAGVLAMICAVWLGLRNIGKRKKVKIDSGFLGISSLLAVLFCITPMVFFLVLGRLGVDDLTQRNFIIASWLFAIPGLIFIYSGVILRSRKVKKLAPALLAIFQIPACLLFLCIYPSKFIQDGKTLEYSTTPLLKILLTALILAALFDVIRRYIKNHKDIYSLISPFSIFAILAALKCGSTYAFMILDDDYHFGEVLLGFWSFYKFGMIPYVDLIQAHGILIDSLPGVFSQFFYDGKASSYIEAGRLGILLGIFLIFYSVKRYTNSTAIGFLAAIFTNIKLAFPTFFLFILFDKDLMAKRAKWLLSYFFLSYFLILGLPSYGAIMAISISPLAAFIFLRFIQEKPETKEITVLLLAFSATLVITLGTPLLDMFMGAATYLKENGKLNQVAYGIPWTISWEHHKVKTLALEIARNSWFLFPPISILLILNNRKKRGALENITLPAIVLIIVSILLISYSQGRIDPGSFSRPGIMSNWVWVSFIPLLAYRAFNNKNLKLAVAGIIFMGGITTAIQPNFYQQFSFTMLPVQNMPPLKDGDAEHLQNIGKALDTDDHWERTAKINKFLRSQLKDNETYIDLTGRNGLYFYLDRKPPVATTAPYNMAPLYQQRQAIQQLELLKPKIALIEANNINHDGRSPSVRAPLLYRYVVDNYEPFIKDGIIYGYRKDVKNTGLKADKYLSSSIKNLTDNNWEKGIHRSKAGLILDDASVLSFISAGQTITLPNGETKKVKEVWKEGSVLWLEGKKLDAKMGAPNEVKLNVNFNAAERRLALLDRAYALPDLEKLPLAWGRSYNSLKKRMTLVGDIEPLKKAYHDIEPKKNGSLKITGTDPQVNYYDLNPLKISGKNAGLLKFRFQCINQHDTPKFQIFWRGDDMQNFTETTSMRFIGNKKGKTNLIIPLDAYPRWLTLSKIKSLRIDLDNPGACDSIIIESPALYQRKSISE